MIDSNRLLNDLQNQCRKLESDLRQQVDDHAELNERLNADYKVARQADRTAATFGVWLDNEITQGAVAWVLACAFVRFAEDNALIANPLLSGPGDNLRRAKDAAREYFRKRPTEHDRHYLHYCFDQMAELPALKELFDRAHNPLFRLPPSPEGAHELLEFWQKVDPDSGELHHDFTDPDLDTRFLGDLYQELSEAARKRYALLQTPEFVEEFILDRTLEPAIKTFGLENIRLIDPTCGSGHFLLGTFDRLFAKWRKQAPGLDSREHVINTLDAIHGVDLNPFAVAIARFRLLVVALKSSGIKTLKEAPGWRFNVTAGDSLLHGRRFDQLDLGADDVREIYAHAYAAEDIDEINRILGQQYHAVVGNPPYITAPDKALNMLYRQRYKSCHRQFSLGVPFTERFFQLAVEDAAHGRAGFIGLITTNSFMKREFGKKLIEQYLPQQDLTHVIDTSGAYIPGHGTPTVILFGRNRSPVANNVRAVLGIRGEPPTPTNAAQGLVWLSVAGFVDQVGKENEYVSVADMPREGFAKHPWSLQGGRSVEIMHQVEQNSSSKLKSFVESPVGRAVRIAAEEIFMFPAPRKRFSHAPKEQFRGLLIGENIRDWASVVEVDVWYPYHDINNFDEAKRDLWEWRTTLRRRKTFQGEMADAHLEWFEYMQHTASAYSTSLSITFAEVATHNHFVLDRGGKVFKQTAPVIKLPAGASEDDHLAILGPLNSSAACFWMKQVFYNKGQGEQTWADRYQHDGTKLKQMPLPTDKPLQLARQLDQLAQQRDAYLPVALAAQLPLTRTELDTARDTAASLLRRMIATQEELDWWCYRAYGLCDDDLCFDREPPEVQLGERAFEIVLARRIEAGNVQTRWFERHGSTPITAVPDRWPADYRALVERRIELIESNAWLSLLEKPEYKRRWNQPGWNELEQDALKSWLLDQLETAAYWPQPELRRIATLAAAAERDGDWMQVAERYTGQPGFDIAALIQTLVQDQTAPALKVLRYKISGLRKRAEWEQTWDKQRREDAIDAEVFRDNPRGDEEAEEDWKERVAAEQTRRKADEVGDIPVPPKYKKDDFLSNTLWRLRGGLDVPKERFFCVPDPQTPGEWLYGWAGWNPAERVQALAGAYIQAEQTGAELTRLIPILVAIDEQLPWVRQWHNDIDPAMDVRPGDYFTSWLDQQLNQQGWTHQTLIDWQPETTRRQRRRA